MYAVLRRGELMALHWEDRYGQLTLGDEGEPPALLDAVPARADAAAWASQLGQ